MSTTNSTARNKHFGGTTTTTSSYNNPQIDITKDEFARISEALKKEEFRKLLYQYCDEIQDPENRKIYEQEITQLEADRGVDITFLKPEPGFVVKTSVNGTQKCFINIAKCNQIDRPSNGVQVNPETGNRGLSWSIPLAQAPPHDDLDAHGKRCRVYDVLFHPDALYLAERNQAFRKCLIDTALDAVEREFKANLDRTNLKFPKIQFKGISHPTVIRKLSKNPSEENAEPHPLEHMFPAKPTSDKVTPKVTQVQNQTVQPTYTTPKYVIKHRRGVDYTECTNELDAKLNLTIPRELVVEIELPLLCSSNECQLDVTEKTIFLLSEKSGAKYRLKLDLPYVVNDKYGSARFDVDTRRLCITLPVVQQSLEEQRNMHATLLHLNREDSGVESDIRDELSSSSETSSPVQEKVVEVEEFSVAAIETSTEDCKNSEVFKETSSSNAASFLKSSIPYQFPSKFDCNTLDDVISLVLHVRNVQPESISVVQFPKYAHLQFCSIGSGYFPVYYAFYFQLPEDAADIEIQSAEPEAWENNVVFNINLNSSSKNVHSYSAGIDNNDLRDFSINEKFQLKQNSRQSAQLANYISTSPALDISVERSDCEQAIEVEIVPIKETQSAGTANTTEDEDDAHSRDDAQQRKNSKRQKKNKKQKRRSLSESVCDDIKAYHVQQQEDNKKSNFKKENTISDTNKPLVSESVAVPKQNSSQQRKQRSYSECRDSAISCSAGGSTLPQSYKGILKHYSRYDQRSSLTDSCSSIDDFSSSYSCSVDGSFASSMRFAQSFSGIPEENISDCMSESCKKTVRFNEVIKKQVFRLDSSILGQRRKNQKRRDRKQRAMERRHSEGDSADYDVNSKGGGESNGQNAMQYFKTGGNQSGNHNKNKLKKQTEHEAKTFDKAKQAQKNKTQTRSRLDSESASSDVENHKNTMMFEMDM